jgi:hypothetical protein
MIPALPFYSSTEGNPVESKSEKCYEQMGTLDFAVGM